MIRTNIYMYRKFYSVSLLGIFLLALCSNASAITVGASSETGILGNPVDVEIGISGLGNFESPSLGGFDLEISYDSSILTFDEVEFGNQLGDGIFTSFQDVFSTDPVGIFELSFESEANLIANQPSDFPLATLTFLASSLGTSNIGIDIFDLSDEVGNSLLAATSVNNGSVSVTQASVIPIPAAFWLFGTGLFGMFAWTKRKAIT